MHEGKPMEYTAIAFQKQQLLKVLISASDNWVGHLGGQAIFLWDCPVSSSNCLWCWEQFLSAE